MSKHIKGLESTGFDGKRERSPVSFLRSLEGVVAWKVEWGMQKEDHSGDWQIHFGDFSWRCLSNIKMAYGFMVQEIPDLDR